ncbi:MAG: hypothetical protein RL685_2306 [Pseudomonadota bacterium]
MEGGDDTQVISFQNNEQVGPISGTLVRATGILRFTITRANEERQTFVGVYSGTGDPALHRLVLFPDAAAGPQLVLSVQQ